MVIRMPRFLRRFVRRKMNPMEEDKAWSWKSRFSIFYAIVAWHAAGFVMYQIFTGNQHWPTKLGITKPEDDMVPPSVYYANLLGVSKGEVVSVRGFSVKRKEVDFQALKEEGEKHTSGVQQQAEASN